MRNIHLALTRLNIFFLSALLFFLTFSFVIPQAYSGEFKLVKRGDHYLPELKEEPAIQLPGSKIQAGLYKYIPSDGGFTGKIGFLIDEREFFFLQSNRSDIKEGEYGLAGGITYGIYKDYLLMDVSWGGTTRNGILFLFRFNKNEIQFLDVISKGSVAHELLDFTTIIEEKEDEKLKYGSFEEKIYPVWDIRSPVWMKINDSNNDGIAETKLIMSKAFKLEPYFQLFLRIKDDKLKINIDANSYKPLFEKEKCLVEQGRDKKRDQYYIYGYLAKQVNMSEIKALGNDPKFKKLISLIGKIENINNALHESVDRERFKLVQYKPVFDSCRHFLVF